MSHLTTGLIFFPSSFQMRGVNLTFTVRSKRSLENENSEAVQMQTLATVDLFINSLEEHHELQKEGNFLHLPPPKFAASVNIAACLNLLSYIPGGLQQKMKLKPQAQPLIQLCGTSSSFTVAHEAAQQAPCPKCPLQHSPPAGAGHPP